MSNAVAGRVSVVIPCFNHARYLPEAIESALDQPNCRVEVVVVDDGSNDDTPEVAQRYPIRLVRQDNAGLSAARNRGLAESEGEFLVFLDADDRLVSDVLAGQRARLEAQPQWAFVSGQHCYMDAQGRVTEQWHGAAVPSEHYAAMLRKNYIGCCSAVMFRRRPLEAVGAFDSTYSCCEDYDLYLRLLQRFPVGEHGEVVAQYRRLETSMSRDAARMLKFALRALEGQRSAVAGNPEWEAAFEEGQRFWRSYFDTR
jgi:glycosyltransferase involved in cell wall biosynthesis